AMMPPLRRLPTNRNWPTESLSRPKSTPRTTLTLANPVTQSPLALPPVQRLSHQPLSESVSCDGAYVLGHSLSRLARSDGCARRSLATTASTSSPETRVLRSRSAGNWYSDVEFELMTRSSPRISS